MSPGRMFASARLPLRILGILLAALWVRLAQVQCFTRVDYGAQVDRAVVRSVPLAAPRGRIFDAAGVALADNRATVHLIADARELELAESRNVARLRNPAGKQLSAEELAARSEAERLRLRAELVADLAEALAGTVGAPRGSAGAPRGSADAKIRDLVERLGRRAYDETRGRFVPSSHVVIARDLSAAEEERVSEVLRRRRVAWAFTFAEDFDRIYPAGAAVSSVVGFLGARQEAGRPAPKAKEPAGPERIGRGGVEGKFEPIFRGTDGREELLRAPLARGGSVDLDRERPPSPGADLHLSVVTTLAAILRDGLLAADREHPCRGGVCGVILEAETGRVLALDSVPSFDPDPKRGEKNHPLTNVALVSPYEPGSAIKPFTVAAALQAGAIRPDSTFDLHHGVRTLPGRAKPIRDSHFDAAHETRSVTEILAVSSNVGAVSIGLRAGARTIRDAFLRFGFGERCGIELPGEARSRLPVAPWTEANTLASVSFGYEMMVTPLRFAAAYAMLANGGLRVEPRIVDAIRHPDGRLERIESPPPVRVLDPDVAAQVREMCRAVITDPEGTAHRRADKLRRGYPEVDDFAGKTGSAVLPKRLDKINGTFACFGPMPEPKLVVLFVAYEPDGVRYGGDVCAEPALETLARSLRALGLTSTGPRSVDLAATGSPAVYSFASVPPDR